MGVRISAKQPADTTNEIALTAKAAAGDPRISRTAPIAGPTTIARFMIADIRALTDARPRSSTRAGIEACRLGLCATWVRDENSAMTIAKAGSPPAAASAASASIVPTCTRSPAISRRRRSNAVGHEPPDRRHDDPRHEMRQLDGRDPGGGARRVEDVDDQRDVVEPVARLGDGLPGQEQAEVAMPQHVAQACHPTFRRPRARNMEHRAPRRGASQWRKE